MVLFAWDFIALTSDIWSKGLKPFLDVSSNFNDGFFLYNGQIDMMYIEETSKTDEIVKNLSSI